MMKPHRKLEVWQKAIELTKNVYELTKKLPKEEKYGLSIQMKRCAVSVPSNIAEGVAKRGQKEAIQFFSMARASLSELDTQLELCSQSGFITEKEFNEISNLLEKVDSLLNGLLKYRNKILSLKKCLFIFLPFYLFTLLPFTAYTLPPLVITEVAPAQSGGQDWVEIFAYDTVSSSDISNLSLEITHYNTSRTFNFNLVIPSTANFSISKERFILIFINTPENTYYFDEKNNLVIKTTFTMTTAGMYSTDVIVSLQTSTGAYIDVLCFADADGSTGNTIKSKFDDVIQSGQWIAPGWDINTSIYSTQWVVSSVGVDNNKTIQRIRGFDGLPKDTNQKTDWEIKPATLGYGYKKVVSVTQKVVEVDKNTNPFCPRDAENGFVKINFNIDDFDAKKTIIIYDIKGKEVIKLLDKDMLPNGDITQYSGVKTGSISWDGKLADDISRAPTGVYIVYFEAYNSATGKKYVGKDVVVVGRKWK